MDIEIGKRISALRNEQGLSRRALAELANVSDSAIKQYETGMRQPKIEQLIRIAQALKINVTYFIPVEKFINMQDEADSSAQLFDVFAISKKYGLTHSSLELLAACVRGHPNPDENERRIRTLPDISQWSYNDLLGLGGREHNAAVIAARAMSRPERTPGPPKLWCIWERYADEPFDLMQEALEETDPRVSLFNETPDNGMDFSEDYYAGIPDYDDEGDIPS